MNEGSTNFTGWSRKRARTEIGPRGSGETGWGKKGRLRTCADNQFIPLTSFTFNDNIHEKIRGIVVWFTYKTCGKIEKQFRKYMWSKCNVSPDETQGKGAKVRRRTHGGMGRAAPSQCSVLSNDNMWREIFQPITKRICAKPKQSRNDLWISIETLHQRSNSPISSKYFIAWFAGPWYTNSPFDSKDKVSKVLKME